ncbi:competence protein ComEC [Anaerobacterium chartisolvens]|uniref:Competence protein ComEC n=1 Tax=Anaerobacterium chartisolvens TaxID=1297424 RepID=A0A369B5P0_9FIRM|nr:DNA internalization-related competence protein ComEC/Rec2 [Anaerobacterium chartisolvens]RCX16635.1 competence protein ComEC [Anaerobacterium chartisolvens]
MKRPLPWFFAALMSGIAAASLTASLLPTVIFALIVFAAGALLSLKMPDITGIVSCVVLFYCIGSFQYIILDDINSKRFQNYIGKDITVEGFIASEPDVSEWTISYFIKARSIIHDDEDISTGGKILLRVLKSESSAALSYGQKIQVRGQMEEASSRRNPGGFNYRRFLLNSGTSATMFAREHNISILNTRHENFVVSAGMAVRNRIIDMVEKTLPRQQAGLLAGILIGYREGLSEDVERAFSDAGLTHIMAVSGANIVFIIIPLAFIFKKLRIKSTIANIIIIIALVFFVFITGFSPSVVRAVIMAVIFLAGRIAMRESDAAASISLAGILMLLFNPYTLFDVGFQLSFGATLSLMLFHKSIKKWVDSKYIPEFLKEVFAGTLAAQAGVLPITAFYFNKVSVISIISNILVVPLTGIITVVGFITVLLGQISLALAELLGYFNCALLTFILYVTKISAVTPFAVLRVVTPHAVIITVYYIAAVYFLWYKPLRNISLKIKPAHYAAVLGALGLVAFVCGIMPGRLDVVFLDVGQGDCAFIKTYSGKAILVDGGGGSAGRSSSNVGETVVIPFLMDYGVPRLDMVIATHGHDDHVQGLLPVLEELAVGRLVIPDSGNEGEFKGLLKIAGEENIPVEACAKGDVITLDRHTYMNILHPSRQTRIDKSALNNGSLVFKLKYKNVSLLMTGDIEAEAEKLLADSGADIRTDILKIAHHGSEYSTSQQFLDFASPKAAIISVGRNNSFGHPSGEVLDRLRENNVKVFRTDESGAVLVKSDGSSIRIETMLEAAAR